MASPLPLALRLYLDAIVFAFGACIGSFLNVCVYRIPRRLSVVAPPSHCPRCRVPIAWYDNIPLVSWLALRGRCRRCGSGIRPRYILIEALTAALFLLVWFKWGDAPRPLGLAPEAALAVVALDWLALSGLLVATFVDLERFIIPDRISLGGIVVGVVAGAALPARFGETTWLGGLAWAAVGAAAGAGLLGLVAVVGRLVFRREAMGMGDVKLLGAIGALFGWRAVLFTVMVSSLVGSVAGLAMVAGGCKRMHGRIPFGPYLALAGLLWLLWGPRLWDVYVHWLLPSLCRN